MKSLKIGKAYTWKNILQEKIAGILLEQKENWLQFAIFDFEENIWDYWMFVNADFVENFEIFSFENFEKIPEEMLTSKFSLEKNFAKIFEKSLLCEILGQKDEILNDFWDVEFQENELRFFPIETDGTYLNDGYLPLQKEEIASVHYNGGYLQYLDDLARKNPKNAEMFAKI